MVLLEIIKRVAKKLQIDATVPKNKADTKDFINAAVGELFLLYPDLLKTKVYADTTAPYSTGTVEVTNGLTLVSGTGTTWVSGHVDMKMQVGTNAREYVVDDLTPFITLSPSITLSENYGEVSSSANSYKIYQDTYLLPSDCWNIETITMNNRKLIKIDSAIFAMSHPNPETEGTGQPAYYRVAGTIAKPHTLDVSSAYLRVQSTSLLDMSGSISIYGKAGGYETTDLINLSGTQTVNGAYDFTEAYYGELTEPMEGRVTIYDSDNVVVDTINPGDTTVDFIDRYQQIKFYPIPDKVYPYCVEYRRQPPTLESDSSYIEFVDAQYESFIIERAFTEGLYFQGDIERADNLSKRWLQAITVKKSIEAEMDQGDDLPSWTIGEQTINTGGNITPWYQDTYTRIM